MRIYIRMLGWREWVEEFQMQAIRTGVKMTGEALRTSQRRRMEMIQMPSTSIIETEIACKIMLKMVTPKMA